MKKLIPLIIIALLLIATTYADSPNDYWPTWRGPDCMGIAPDANPPLTWSETENIKWKIKLTGDASNSSPIIYKDKIFFQTAVKTDAPPADTGEYKFNLVCLDRKTGKEIWQKTARREVPHQGHHDDHGFASYSPVTDGKFVWASFGSRGLYCFDLDGNQKWQEQLSKMNTRNSFGEGGSPLLTGNIIVVLMDHEGDSYIAAFNKATGKQIWKKERNEPTSWSTPIAAKVNGKTQIIVNGTNRVRAYDPENGDVIWECGGQTTNAVPTPVLGSDMVYCTSGFRGSALLAIKLGKTGDLTDSDAIAWQVDTATPYVPSPLLYKDKLYVLAVNNAVLSCYNAKTGKPFYQKQSLDDIKDVYASPTAAANRIYYVGRNGVTCVIKPSETLEVLAVNKLDDSIDCSPAFAENEIYLKGKQYFYCIAETK